MESFHLTDDSLPSKIIVTTNNLNTFCLVKKTKCNFANGQSTKPMRKTILQTIATLIMVLTYLLPLDIAGVPYFSKNSHKKFANSALNS